VSDISVSWLAVSGSAWRQRLQVAALGLTAGVATGVAIVLWLGSEPVAMIGGAAAICTAMLTARFVVRGQRAGHWCIRADGGISIRWDGDHQLSNGVAAAYASSFLIVLQDGRRTLEVWRDATSPTAFRRLSVALRWRVARNAHVDAAQ
jgi:hypothetical protein